VTRATYIDLAQSLSTDDFLLVFRRFVGVYRTPQCIYSDNGTNFVGAERELLSCVNLLKDSAKLKEFAARQAIDWKFQPPASPHFGGAHESLVKSAKRALYRALEMEKVKHRYPTEETMRTLLFEVAGILNTRTLYAASSDPADFRPLAPKDFLNMSDVHHVPPGSFVDALPREQYRYLQRATNMFWDLWKGTFFQTLAARRKWTRATRNFAVGDAVLVADPNLPRGKWTFGRVTAVHPGQDRLVRVVTVKTENGSYLRNIHRLCLLEPAEIPRKDVQPDAGENGAATS
jgi:hypothetical protein